MAMSVTLLGSCGPNRVVMQWNNAMSSMTATDATLFPNGTISGALRTSPMFVVH
ncbi:hypothetical protein LMG18101_00234 [Ralstonia flaminis]|uniref:Uncharacterized protein n=1 Tax=Ralstonia flaminis TaxID=3058597 RepID=A0ABN9JF76_9RALS|nr:hypothetical protein LMG18101_00234 [Ralstonia sp. LMG 18101]